MISPFEDIEQALSKIDTTLISGHVLTSIKKSLSKLGGGKQASWTMAHVYYCYLLAMQLYDRVKCDCKRDSCNDFVGMNKKIYVWKDEEKRKLTRIPAKDYVDSVQKWITNSLFANPKLFADEEKLDDGKEEDFDPRILFWGNIVRHCRKIICHLIARHSDSPAFASSFFDAFGSTGKVSIALAKSSDSFDNVLSVSGGSGGEGVLSDEGGKEKPRRKRSIFRRSFSGKKDAVTKELIQLSEKEKRNEGEGTDETKG
jgi:hypothetical protein